MESQKRKHYTVEYKTDVVRMIEERQSRIADVAKDMGVSIDLLYAWKRQYGKAREKADPGEATAEIRRLQKRLTEIEEERDILKKAMAIFTQKPKSGITL
jgi:transposase